MGQATFSGPVRSKAGYIDLDSNGKELGEVLVAEVLISSAEVLALNATPKEIVAAPGADYALQYLGGVLLIDFNSAAYVAGAGEDFVLQTDTTNEAVSVAVDGTVLAASADQLVNMPPVATDPATAGAIIENEGIEATILVGELATGDSPFKVRVWYRKLKVSTLESIA